MNRCWRGYQCCLPGRIQESETEARWGVIADSHIITEGLDALILLKRDECEVRFLQISSVT